MATPLEAAIVRIWSADKTVVGAGVLITDTLILTCAHVVAQALGIPDDTPEMPVGELVLDFPLADPGTYVTAQVSQWLPVQPDGSGDLACLELQGSLPKDAQPVPLTAAEELWGHPLRAFGFLAAHNNGVWASGVLRAKQANGWIQIEDVKQTGYFIEPGFSGTPVWDDEVQGVVGITVAAERQREVRAAFVIPVPAIIGSFPDLKHVVRAAPLSAEEDGGKTIQSSTKKADRDYFEKVDGNVYTAPVTIVQPPDDVAPRTEQRWKGLGLAIGGLLLGGALWLFQHFVEQGAAQIDVTRILTHPLSLVGAGLFFVFSVHRVLVKSHILPPVDAIQGSEIVKHILRYGFAIAIVTIVCGFGLAALSTYLGHRGTNQPAKPRKYRFDADQNGVQSLNTLFQKVIDEGIVQLEFVPKQLRNVVVCDPERPGLTLSASTSTEILQRYITQLYPACFRWEQEGIIVRIHVNAEEHTLLTRRDAVQGGERWFCNCADETIARLLQRASQRMKSQ